MTFLFILMGFAGFISAIIAWVNYFRADNLEDEIFRIKRDLEKLKGQYSLLSQKDIARPEIHTTPVPQTSSSQPVYIPPVVSEPVMKVANTSDSIKNDDFDWGDDEREVAVDIPAYSPAPQEIIAEKSTFEFNIGAKLPVWIGAISLVCAGFFLVKYSIDAGFFGPTTRVIMGLLFGLGLIGTGRVIANHPRIHNAMRMAQGLVGAGLITLTFSLYSAVHMYEMISPVTGFCGMVAVVVATMVLALRMGQPVALFGMIGGFLAPALFSSNEPNFIALFGYLFILYSGLQTIMFRQKWWGLSVASLAGVFIWGLLALVSPAFKDSGAILSVFVLAVSTMTLFSGRRELIEDENKDTDALFEFGPHLLNLLAIAGSTILLIFLQDKVQFGVFDWLMSGLLSLGVVGLSYFCPKLYSQAVWGKLASDILLLSIYLPQTDVVTGAIISFALLGVYAILPAIILAKGEGNTKPWVITQVAGSIALYLISYLKLPAGDGVDTDLIWGPIALLGALYMALQVKQWLDKRTDDVVAIYALATTAFLSIGLTVMLPMEYLPTAIALEIAAIFWIYQKLPIAFLQKIAFILLAVFAALNLPLILEFIGVVGYSLFGEDPDLPHRFVSAEGIVQSFTIPAVALGLAYKMYIRQKIQNDIMHLGLAGGALSLLMGAAYITVRMIFQMDTVPSLPIAGFMEREVITLMIAAFGGLVIGYAKQENIPQILKWGYALIIVAIFRNVYFDLIIHNPMWSGSQNVGTLPLFNGVTLTYGCGLALVLYAKYRDIGGGMQSMLKALALVFLFALVSLNVRQFFHGANLEQGAMTNSELYGYSIVWMITGLGLLAYGIKRADKNLRLAAMAFLTLTIVKVFLIDASELEGLYRIFSFLGLGISLIGLSMFYTRFMARSGASGE